MLNEIKEFEQYTCPVTSIKDNAIEPRLKFNTLIEKKRAGMARALTIIARHFIFAKQDYKTAFSNNGVFNDDSIVDALKSWCGLKGEKEIDLFEQDWLKRYVFHVFFEKYLNESKELYKSNYELSTLLETIKEVPKDKLVAQLKKLKVKETIDNYRKTIEKDKKQKGKKEQADSLGRLASTIDFLVSYEKDFNPAKPLFTNGTKKATKKTASAKIKVDYLNDLKAIKFGSIIATALNTGALKRYYLVCKADPIGYVRKGKNNSKIGATAKKRALVNNCRDIILKATASYLLQREYSNPEYVQDYVVFNRQDLINWLTVTELKTPDLLKYKFVTKDGNQNTEPIFEFMTIAGNTTKMKINPLWLETLGFKLVEEHNIDKPDNQGLIFYSDWGSGMYLVEEKRYED